MGGDEKKWRRDQCRRGKKHPELQNYCGSKNIVLGNAQHQTVGTETERNLQNLNAGETSSNDLFSRTSIKSQQRKSIVKIYFIANS